jgi:hypothetical protein
MVSANEAGFYLWETGPLSHNILFTPGVVPGSDVGQRTNLNVSRLLKGYCNLQVEAGYPIYPAFVRDSAKSGLGSAANRYLNYPRESNYVNTGGFYRDAKVSSPPMTDRSVGAAIVVGGWESQPQGEGPQEIDTPNYLLTAIAPGKFGTNRKVQVVNGNGMTNPGVTLGEEGQPLESPLQGNLHGGFGGESEETCQ